MKTARIIAVASLTISIGCSTRIAPNPDVPVPRTFSHDLLDRVLSQHVDADGRVDYLALQRRADELDGYYRLLERYSPDRTPELFPTESSRLVYWINAYNAATMKAVLNHYPIGSVLDVKKPKLALFLPKTSGFFYFQKVVLGGKDTSLYDLENDIIRKRFDEPRIHFALNCASSSCPELPRRAFTAAALEDELERETRKFLSQRRNIRIDHAAKIVYLSSIFDWYREDFESWYREQHETPNGGLLDYVALYTDDAMAGEFRDYDIRFIPYDWSLNDQDGAKATASRSGDSRGGGRLRGSKLDLIELTSQPGGIHFAHRHHAPIDRELEDAAL